MTDVGPIRSIDAVTLSVADMDRSLDFYVTLGFAVAFGGRGITFTTLRAGSQYLNIMEVPTNTSTGIWGRVIFHVDDVDAMHSRILAGGGTPEAAPRDAEWGERYFHVRDPDGHELSFAKRL